MICHTYIMFWRSGCEVVWFMLSQLQSIGKMKSLRVKTVAVNLQQNDHWSRYFSTPHTDGTWVIGVNIEEQTTRGISGSIFISVSKWQASQICKDLAFHPSWMLLFVGLSLIIAKHWNIRSKNWPRSCFHGAGVFIRRVPCVIVSMFAVEFTYWIVLQFIRPCL